MSTELNNNSSQEAPQWMRDMFEELKDMFGLFPDADKLDLEEMQRRLDEQQAQDIMARAGPYYRGGGG
jgi:hypothetical protein